MRIPRFLVDPLPEAGPESAPLALPPEVLHHLARVLRLGPGETIGLFDGKGREARALLEAGPGRNLQARLTASVRPADQDAALLQAAFSAPRGERLERLIEQATELGATELTLVRFERTPPRAWNRRPGRLEKIAAGACAQCGRARLPLLAGPLTLGQFLARPDLPPHRILLDSSGPPLAQGCLGTVLLVGPEGGLEAAERARAKAAGFVPRSLGALTLRVETAVASALARLGLLP